MRPEKWAKARSVLGREPSEAFNEQGSGVM